MTSAYLEYISNILGIDMNLYDDQTGDILIKLGSQLWRQEPTQSLTDTQDVVQYCSNAHCLSLPGFVLIWLQGIKVVVLNLVKFCDLFVKCQERLLPG